MSQDKPRKAGGPLPRDPQAERDAADYVEAVKRQVKRDMRGVADMLAAGAVGERAGGGCRGAAVAVTRERLRD